MIKGKSKLPIIDATHCECIQGNKQWDDGFVYGVIAVRQACEHGKWHWQNYLEEGHCISDSDKVTYLEHIIREMIRDIEKVTGEIPELTR